MSERGKNSDIFKSIERERQNLSEAIIREVQRDNSDKGTLKIQVDQDGRMVGARVDATKKIELDLMMSQMANGPYMLKD